ncbi:OCIA domain-containing protein 1 isoform X1 [Leguminivora glycinivorella]|uniref:OCIA domain-containing protein 1 isoform X1 n=1 Tax=Leguminivora glycinivorella TaxID=1035111 RepID=UPI00200C4CB0|nr:OCIA domain-containing protein 1 isoform X1 [Leguminivora glycinivorella]
MSEKNEENDPSKRGRVECDNIKSPLSECAPPVKNITHPLRYYEFTRDEIKALEECDKESFYRRCLPYSTLLATATYAAVKYGYLKPNPRFGAIPKISFAVLVGYFVGKLSYQEACAEKLMALPGSYIGQLLREKKEGRMGGSGKAIQNTPSMFGAGPNDIYSDAGPGSSLDLDTDRPVFSDDSYRPDHEGGGFPSLDPDKKRPSLSYDDLRRRNRGEYTEARQDPYRVDPNTVPPVTRANPVIDAPPPAPRRTNKYGDVMD